MSEHEDFLKAKGSVVIIKVTEAGHVEETRIPNLVVNVGKEYIARRMAGESGDSANVMRSIAIGIGSTAAAAGQTTLDNEIARNATTVSGGTRTGNAILYTTTFAAGTGTGAIQEAGVFNNTTGNAGIMLCRTKFDTVNKGAGDTITINWTVQVT